MARLHAATFAPFRSKRITCFNARRSPTRSRTDIHARHEILIFLYFKGARTPVFTSPSLRIVRLSGPSLTEGIENHQVEGVPVRVYSAAKTVADCFKFRNKVGLDVAIEALKDSLRQKKANVNEIYRYAKVCRVSNVIRPYMEAL